MCEKGVVNEVLSVEGWEDSSGCKFESLARKFESLARKFESPYSKFERGCCKFENACSKFEKIKILKMTQFLQKKGLF